MKSDKLVPARRARILIELTVICSLIMHCAAGVLYCDRATSRLSFTAEMAVRAAARSLPADPSRAAEVAYAYARRAGIAGGEIMYVNVSSDGSAISIKLSQRVPEYFLLMTVGLPGKISATATAKKTRGLTVAAMRTVPVQVEG